MGPQSYNLEPNFVLYDILNRILFSRRVGIGLVRDWIYLGNFHEGRHESLFSIIKETLDTFFR